MKEGPLLSVIVPIYNVFEYLEECINSIICQTYDNLDIILVDDGSHLGEAEICDKYALVDNRISVIHKSNSGLVAARKSGLAVAKGKYITFVDGDDRIETNYYKKMMKHVVSEDPDVVATGIVKFFSDGQVEILEQPIEDGIYEGNSLTFLKHNMNSFNEEFANPGIFPSTCTKIFKKEILIPIIESVPDRITMGEDAALTYPCILKSRKIVIDSSSCGYEYRITDDSMTKRFDESFFERISLLYSFLIGFCSNDKDTLVKRQFDIYRAYLIYLGLNNMMSSIENKDVFLYSKRIVTQAGQLSVFDSINDILKLKIPRSLFVYLMLIDKKMWRLHSLVWIVRGRLLNS